MSLTEQEWLLDTYPVYKELEDHLAQFGLYNDHHQNLYIIKGLVDFILFPVVPKSYDDLYQLFKPYCINSEGKVLLVKEQCSFIIAHLLNHVAFTMGKIMGSLIGHYIFTTTIIFHSYNAQWIRIRPLRSIHEQDMEKIETLNVYIESPNSGQYNHYLTCKKPKPSLKYFRDHLIDDILWSPLVDYRHKETLIRTLVMC